MSPRARRGVAFPRRGVAFPRRGVAFPRRGVVATIRRLANDRV